VVDLGAKLPGRGAWLHAERECVDELVRAPGALSRALHSDAPLAVVHVPGQLRERVQSAALDGLSQAAAAGALVGGHDRLAAELAQGTVVEVVLASDASPRTVASLREVARPGVEFTALPLDREALGARVGRGSRAALGVRRSRAAAHLLSQLRRLRALG
jgi:hypothetical protein